MLNITKATDIKESKKTYLIYGAPGVGKTSTLKYLKGKTLIIDVDKTSHVLKGTPNIDIYSLDTSHAWKDWDKILLEVGSSDYDNVVIDNITELERSFLAQLGTEGNNNGIPTMMHYQQVQFKLIKTLRYLKNQEKNIVLTAWETSEEYVDADTGQKYTISLPDIQRKIRNNVMGLCDVVARLTVQNDEDKLTRGFYLSPTRSIYAKNQIDDRKGCLQDELFTPTVSKAIN